MTAKSVKNRLGNDCINERTLQYQWDEKLMPCDDKIKKYGFKGVKLGLIKSKKYKKMQIFSNRQGLTVAI